MYIKIWKLHICMCVCMYFVTNLIWTAYALSYKRSIYSLHLQQSTDFNVINGQGYNVLPIVRSTWCPKKEMEILVQDIQERKMGLLIWVGGSIFFGRNIGSLSSYPSSIMWWQTCKFNCLREPFRPGWDILYYNEMASNNC